MQHKLRGAMSCQHGYDHATGARRRGAAAQRGGRRRGGGGAAYGGVSRGACCMRRAYASARRRQRRTNARAAGAAASELCGGKHAASANAAAARRRGGRAAAAALSKCWLRLACVCRTANVSTASSGYSQLCRQGGGGSCRCCRGKSHCMLGYAGGMMGHACMQRGHTAGDGARRTMGNGSAMQRMPCACKRGACVGGYARAGQSWLNQGRLASSTAGRYGCTTACA